MLVRRPHDHPGQQQVSTHGHVIDAELLTQPLQRPTVAVELGSIKNLVRRHADRAKLGTMAGEEDVTVVRWTPNRPAKSLILTPARYASISPAVAEASRRACAAEGPPGLAIVFQKAQHFEHW
jgi:hypothetical protein